MKLSKLKLKGTEIAVRSADVQETQSVLQKIETVYDEQAKLVFLFDVSTSMGLRVSQTYTEQFLFPPEKLVEIRQRVAEAIAAANVGAMFSNLLYMADPERGPNGEFVFNPKDDEEVKARVVRNDLIGVFGIEVDWEKHGQQPPKRIELVKRLAISELRNRFKKFPQSCIAVVPFGSYPQVMFDDGTPEELWSELDKLCTCYGTCGGGTNILRAVACAVEVCRSKPSPIGVHHFIIVSDGEDHAANARLPKWTQTLKASGVVLDYIHIGDREPNTGIAQVCRELGGDCVVVNSEASFREKFVEAVNRKMLPPA